MTSRTIFYESGPLRLACDVAGEGDLVVFLHGIGGNRSNWHRQLSSFSNGYCAVAWDARGYGLSDDPDPPDGLRFEDYADDLCRLIAHFGAERAHVVGLSMGGMIAQDFCRRYPDHVASLVLAATSSGFGHLGAAAREEFLGKRLAPLEAGLSPADMARAVVEVLVAPGAGQEVRDELQQSIAAIHPEPYKAALRAFVTTDFRSDLAAIAAPTLVIVGSADRIFPETFSRELATAIPGAELRVIPNAGHLCNMEAYAEFNRVVRAFLDRQRA